jgi:hypothetical protein
MTAANTHAVRSALETAGILFLDPVEDVHDGGVALRPGAKPRRGLVDGETMGRKDNVNALDADMAAYWREHPQEWSAISNAGRHILSAEMFGDISAADEFFGSEQG